MAEKPAPTVATLLEFPEGPEARAQAGTGAAPASSVGGAVVGHLVGWCDPDGPEAGALLVDFPQNPGAPVPARSVVPLEPAAVSGALRDRQGVLLLFEGGRLDAPIIVGLLQPPVPLSPADAPALPSEALVDGQRVVIEGRDEIVLHCGKASITLRRNGRVVIRGTYVETRSSGVNRVKGGSVEIN